MALPRRAHHKLTTSPGCQSILFPDCFPLHIDLLEFLTPPSPAPSDPITNNNLSPPTLLGCKAILDRVVSPVDEPPPPRQGGYWKYTNTTLPNSALTIHSSGINCEDPDSSPIVERSTVEEEEAHSSPVASLFSLPCIQRQSLL